jgi:glycosyltransferase involved in cell wall biosynthesis
MRCAVKILHLNNEKTWRGGERQTLLLAAELHRRGVTSVIACRPDSPLAERAKQGGVPMRRLGGANLPAMFDLVRLAREFDLLHCHTGRTHSLAVVTARWHRKPVIATRRVDVPPSNTWFNRRKYLGIARLVCISRVIADQMGAFGVPERQLALIPSAVPVPAAADTAAMRTRLCALLGIAPTARIVGNIAALVGHKDHATLLRAARRVIAEQPDTVFVIIGEGALRGELLHLRRELGLEHSVHFAGYLPQAEQFLPAFDVFAMSSSSEGLGSIVLDAFAARVPVATTAGGGLAELVREGETGLLAPVGDDAALAAAIARLLTDKALAARVTRTARERVLSEFSVAGMANRYVELYREALAMPDQPTAVGMV